MAAEHATKIYTVAVIGIVVIVAFLALTSVGHVIDAATQHFMLYYAGVFALIALCASVGLGLVATDRMFMSPGHRVLVQSAHRAASFGAVAFLIIHIVTEILAQRVHVLDAVIPFLSPFRTFYIGLGTIASDLILLLLITGILRGRFNESGKAWRWRAIHYTSYLAFVFGVWHGLLGGRAGKPYVDWSYGFVVAFVLGGLAIRVLSNSLRPKENLSAPPVDQAANSASAPLRAAAMLAQYGSTRGGRNVIQGATTGSQPMLSAPVTATVVTALPAGGGQAEQGQPYYEPGYEGPPRYLGAPRAEETGPMPRTGTGPMPRANSGPMPRATTGSMPRAATGPMPRTGTGPTPTGRPMPPTVSGPMPRAGSGPMPRAATGSFPAAPPRTQSWTGPMPGAATGSMPQVDDGWGTGPRPVPQMDGGWGTGPRPVPQMDGGWGTGSRPVPQMDDGWGTGPRPVPRADDGWGTGPRPVPSGPGLRGATGPRPRGGTRPMPTGSGPYQRPQTGPMPQADGSMPPNAYPDGAGGSRPNPQGWLEASHDGGWHEQPPWEDEFAQSNSDFRYREPGPGMPGYRGSRENRYGGDRY